MPKMELLHHSCPRYQVLLEKWVVPGLKQKHTRSLRGSERKESNEKTRDREEPGGSPRPAHKSGSRLHIYKYKQRHEKGPRLDLKHLKKKVNQTLPRRRGASLRPKHNRHKLRPGKYVTPEAKTRGSQILDHPSIHPYIHPYIINQPINQPHVLKRPCWQYLIKTARVSFGLETLKTLIPTGKLSVLCAHQASLACCH